MTAVRRAWQALERRLRSQRVCITEAEGRLRPRSLRGSAVVVCGPGFDQRVPNAATMSRLGWCRGFESLGVPYRLVASQALAAELDQLDDPMVWISRADHARLPPDARAALRHHRHAVLVDPAFPDSSRWLAARGLPNLAMDATAVQQVLATRPRFVFTIAGPSGWPFYALWLQSGVPLMSLPLACDTTLYNRWGNGAATSATDIAFVGGYWDYKARHLDQYLQPDAARLTVYGWSRWPYGRDGGVLPLDCEAILYRTARLCPVINEPHVPVMGIDINERVFKVLGAGGMALTDATTAYRDWFGPDELLVPRSVAEYHQLARALLAGEIDGAALRKRGQAAVLARHTYGHRAAQFCAWMGAQPQAARATA